MLSPVQGFTYNKFEKPNDWPKIDETFDYKIEGRKLLCANPNIYLENSVSGEYNVLITIDEIFNLETDELDFTFYANDKDNSGPLGGAFTNGKGFVLAGYYTSFNGERYLRETSDGYSELQKNTFSIKNGKSYLNGAPYIDQEEALNQKSDVLSVFCSRYTNGYLITSSFFGRVYNLIWKRNGNEIYHLVPVPEGLKIGNLTISKNGLFDIINQTFYGNSLSGNLSIGKDYSNNLNVINNKIIGPIDYTVYGNPTIENGLVSVSSSSDYLKLNSQLTYNNFSNLDVYVRFKTSVEFPNSNSSIIGPDPYNTPMIWIWGSYVFFNLVTVNYSVGPVSADTWYRVRMKGINGTWTLTIYDDSGNVFETSTTTFPTQSNDLTRDVVILPYYGTSEPQQYFDLNNSYIKLNGTLWFGKEDWNPAIYDDKSIYLLSAHTSDYSSYNQLGINAEVSNSGSYNVWVDNQKIVDSSSSNADINWSNLALTTGYSITTPTTLKAHVIKIEPSNSENNITSFSADIEDSDEISEGILQSIINTNSSISLNNAFASEVTSNPLLKSIEGKIKLLDENSLISFTGSNSSIEHIDTITYSGSNGASLSNSLNGLDKLKYIRLDGNFNTNSTNKFSGNSNLEKLDLTTEMETAQKCFKNTHLKQLPKVTFNSSDLTNVITHDTNLLPTSIDLSGNTSLEKIDIYGSSSKPINGLKSLIVSNVAPFTGNSPQINISYTGLDKTALISLFNSLPNVSSRQVINIVGCVGTLDLSNSDKEIATNKGWTIHDS